MSIKAKRLTALVVAVSLGVAALGVAVFTLTPGPSQVAADDAYRTTSLVLSGGQITATMNSTLTADETWSVTWFFTPSGGSESQEGGAETSRTDGITSSATFTASTDVSSYPSGATVRALFQFFAPSGTLNHSVSRAVATP
jgi:hypothetical protein